MNPCPQCGAVPQAADKFCNICGTPTAGPGLAPGAPPQQGFAPPQPAYGAAAPQAGVPGAYGAPPAAAARCQGGHDIAPGASYCAYGHPLALDAMPFANDQYGGGYAQGAPQPGFGAAPQGYAPAPGQGYAPQGQGFPSPGYPDPSQGYGAQAPYADPNAYQGYAQPQGYAPPQQAPQQGFGAPAGAGLPYDPNGLGAPPQAYGQGAYGAQQGYGAQPQGYGAQQGYGAPQQQPGFGAPPQQAAGFAPPAPAPATPSAAPLSLPPNALRGFLVAYQANQQGEFWPLTGGRKTVGRNNSGEQVDVPLADATISSRHAAIITDATAGTVHVEDTGSTNGTFVNDEHLGANGKRELRDGDKVRFGGFTTIVKIITRI